MCQTRVVNEISLFSELNVRRAVSVKLFPQQMITIVANDTKKPILYGAIITLLICMGQFLQGGKNGR